MLRRANRFSPGRSVTFGDKNLKLAENDPAILSGVFNYQIKEWSTVFNKFEGNKHNFDQGYLEYYK
ncbi:hypothetical protein CGZ75_09295 [Paenibacillus herberti]|uniref:Uncharacterized protein n=1 Tax=Paenibacillus herberti TaxID=1619309 RepID=A0A229P426_9BACL|nr:hypothetical protein CGZ75_09295 [Paenibacillus herberti]